MNQLKDSVYHSLSTLAYRAYRTEFNIAERQIILAGCQEIAEQRLEIQKLKEDVIRLEEKCRAIRNAAW